MTRLMPFSYPQTTLARRHGPRGYQRYQSFKPWLRDECTFRCIYCLVRETWSHDGPNVFGVDHIVPKSKDSARECEYANLIYACNRCNALKGSVTDGPNPLAETFDDLLVVGEDGTITAKNPRGKRMIRLFLLDSTERTRYRAKLIRLVRKLRNVADRRAWIGFPEDLPDLRLQRPPDGNDRPEGLEQCYFVQREQGVLPDTY